MADECASAVAEGWIVPQGRIVREVPASVRQETDPRLAMLELRKSEGVIKKALRLAERRRVRRARQEQARSACSHCADEWPVCFAPGAAVFRIV